MLQCPTQAISELPHAIGRLTSGITTPGILFAQGELTISEPMGAPVIRQLKNWQLAEQTINILDAPPGASCPVVETLRQADFVLLVTEPTPFGLHDLKQIVQLVRQMHIPFAVVLNRSTSGNDQVATYCADNKIEILLRIPFDKQYAAHLAAGKTLLEIAPQFGDPFWQMYQYIENALSKKEGRHA
jgi:MinD superfamily P-loop ATPase